MNEMLRELEDDIRRARYEKLWHSFGKLMVWASVAVVLGTIVVVVWQNHERNEAMVKTTELIRGIDRLQLEDYKGAISVFSPLAQDKSSAHYGLAMLRIAQAKRGLSDIEGANAAYAELADKDPVFGGLASLMLPPKGDDVEKPRKGTPFYLARSEMRGWKLLSIGKTDNAVAQFLALYQDKDAPFSLRLRMTEALQHLAPARLAEVDEHLKQELEKQNGGADAQGAQ